MGFRPNRTNRLHGHQIELLLGCTGLAFFLATVIPVAVRAKERGAGVSGILLAVLVTALFIFGGITLFVFVVGTVMDRVMRLRQGDEVFVNLGDHRGQTGIVQLLPGGTRVRIACLGGRTETVELHAWQVRRQKRA